MSDTPRTDAAEWKATAEQATDDHYFDVVYASFARQLERENAELREACEKVAKWLDIWSPPPAWKKLRDYLLSVLAKAEGK